MAKATTVDFTVEIKSEFNDLQIGYNGSIAKLKDRADHDDLMEIALNSQDPSLLKVFVKVPTAEEWIAYKGAKFIEQNPE